MPKKELAVHERAFRLLVCGGRNYGQSRAEREHMYSVLDGLMRGWPHIEQHGLVLIHGDAVGADTTAKDWAIERGYEQLAFPAQWDDTEREGAVVKKTRGGKKYDATAGWRRNLQMLKEGKPDLVVAFPGGKGTNDMVARTKTANVDVLRIP